MDGVIFENASCGRRSFYTDTMRFQNYGDTCGRGLNVFRSLAKRIKQNALLHNCSASHGSHQAPVACRVSKRRYVEFLREKLKVISSRIDRAETA